MIFRSLCSLADEDIERITRIVIRVFLDELAERLGPRPKV